MSSLEELCDVLSLPPEIVESILTGVSFCTQCQKWTQFVTCSDCPEPTCLDCSKKCDGCSYCFYCKSCSPKRWCPTLEEYTCCDRYNSGPRNTWKNPVCYVNDNNCSHCHDGHECNACRKYFCCTHYMGCIRKERYDYDDYFMYHVASDHEKYRKWGKCLQPR